VEPFAWVQIPASAPPYSILLPTWRPDCALVLGTICNIPSFGKCK